MARIVALLLLIALAAAGVAAAGEAETAVPEGRLALVRLRPEATVAGGEIRLGEIADVAAVDPGLKERLEELVVGTAALPGSARSLSAGAITLRLRQARLPVERIALEPPGGEVHVITSAQQIGKERLVEAIEAWYRSALKVGPEARLHLDVQVSEQMAPEGSVELRPVQGEPRWGKSVIVFDLVVDGKPVRRVSATVEAAVEQEVWVAARDMLRLEIVGPDDVRAEWRRLSSPTEKFDFSTALRTTRYVREGTVLTSKEVEPVPDLLRGERVLIVAELDGLVVRVVGESMAEARVGQTVPVKNLNSGQVVYGTLTEEGFVAVKVW